MLSLAIFDLDQTLVDTLPRFYRVFKAALEKNGCAVPAWEEFVIKYKEDTLNDYVCIDKRVFWDYFLSHYNDIYCERDSVIDGAYSTLKEIHELGIKIVIITGRMVPATEVWKELKRFKLDTFVAHVYTRLDNYCDGRKRTELIKDAMKRFNATPQTTVFVADYWPDMQSGREAGVLTVGVLTGHEDREKLLDNGADITIDSVKNLIPVLRSRALI